MCGAAGNSQNTQSPHPQHQQPYICESDSGRHSRPHQSRHPSTRDATRPLTAAEVAEARMYDASSVFYFDKRSGRNATMTGTPAMSDFKNGFYKCIKHDHIAYRYELLGGLGHGAFGDVIHAFDHKLHRDVAIKIAASSAAAHRLAKFEESVFSHMTARGPLVNVVPMLESFAFRGHNCIVFEKMSHGNLAKLIRGNQRLRFSQIQQLAQSILSCLQEVHARGIIHGDVKPENFLLTDERGCNVKIVDFGLSSLMPQRMHKHSFGSLIYSAPEVNLNAGYDQSIDMWAVGCIVAEMCTGKHLFTGKGQSQLIDSQVQLLGFPDQGLLSRAARTWHFFDLDVDDGLWAPRGDKQLPSHDHALKHAIGPLASPTLLDFAARCLQWSPDKRMTAAQALEHLFLSPLSSSASIDSAVSDLMRAFSQTTLV